MTSVIKEDLDYIERFDPSMIDTLTNMVHTLRIFTEERMDRVSFNFKDALFLRNLMVKEKNRFIDEGDSHLIDEDFSRLLDIFIGHLGY